MVLKTNSASGGTASRLSTTAIIISAMLFAAALRMLPIHNVFGGETVFFFDGDNYLHLRRILLHIKAFPQFVVHDWFESYPEGLTAISPPLLDWLLSAVSLIVGLGNPSRGQVELVAGMAPPVVAAITVLALYIYARQAVGRGGAALVSLFFLALMPAHIINTFVGRPDNEMMEPLMTALMFAAYLRGSSSGRAAAGMLAAGMLAGVAAFFALLFWRGATLWISVIFISAVVDLTIDFLKSGSHAWKHRAYALMFALPAALTLPLCVFNVWGRQDTFSYNIISWFHVAAFSAGAVALLGYGLILKYWLGRGWSKPLFPAAAGGVLAVNILIFVFVPALRDNAVRAMGILGVGELNPWIETIGQYSGLFDAGLMGPVRMFGWVFWLSPAILVALLWAAYKRDDRALVFYAITTAAMLAAALSRSRFGHVLALNLSIAAGWLVHRAFVLTRERITLKTGKTLSAYAVSAALCAFLAYPLAPYALGLPGMRPGVDIRGDILDAVTWLGKNTPSVGDPYGPEKPSYSVVARWDYSGWIEYVSERPVVATLFGNEAYGLEEAVGFYLSEDEAAANGMMDAMGARYVMVSPPTNLEYYARIIGARPEGYMGLVRSERTGAVVHRPGPKYSRIMLTRLAMADGVGVTVGPFVFGGLDRYRLVYESEGSFPASGFPAEVKKIKIFEYVRGAHIEVKTRPGEDVEVSGRVRTNQGREFVILRSGKAGADGRAEFILPYSESGTPYETGIVGAYVVSSSSGRKADVLPTDNDVVEGKTLKVGLGR